GTRSSGHSCGPQADRAPAGRERSRWASQLTLSEQACRCQRSEMPLLSGTDADGVPGGETGMRKLALALQEEDLGENRDGDLAGRLVAEAQPDRRMQAGIVARIAPQPPGDAAQDQRD